MLQCINILKYYTLKPENVQFWGLGILAILYATAIFSPLEQNFLLRSNAMSQKIHKIKCGNTERWSFSKIKHILETLYLIEVQSDL